jgi:hypothetical protein
MDSKKSVDPFDLGPTPSLLDLLKLERMWVNEPTPELEGMGKKHRHHKNHGPRDRSASVAPSSGNKKPPRVDRPSAQMNTRIRQPKVPPNMKGPVLVRTRFYGKLYYGWYEISIASVVQFPIESSGKYEIWGFFCIGDCIGDSVVESWLEIVLEILSQYCRRLLKEPSTVLR